MQVILRSVVRSVDPTLQWFFAETYDTGRFLCEGTRHQVMRILVSIYGWTPSRGFRLKIYEEKR